MVRGILTLFATAGLLAGCDQAADEAAEPDYVRAHTIKELMATVVDPQAQVFWHSAGSVSDETGEHDLTPTTDEGWLATRSAAATVTEMGNLLMTPLYAEGRGPDWMEFSKGMVEMGRKAEKAAADRDSDAIFLVGGDLYNVCSACHQAYPPPVPPAPTEPDQ